MAYSDGDQESRPPDWSGQPLISAQRSEFEVPADAVGGDPLPVVLPPLQGPSAPVCGHIEELQAAREENEFLRQRNLDLRRKYVSVKSENEQTARMIRKLAAVLLGAVEKISAQSHKVPDSPRVEVDQMVQPRPAADALEQSTERPGGHSA